MRLQGNSAQVCLVKRTLLFCCHPRRGSAVPTLRVHPPWDGSKGCHLDRRRSRSGETPVFRSLYSHTFWNETEINMAVPCGRTCFSCCHPRRGSAFLTVRVHPIWNGSKGCHLDPGMAPKAVISTGGEAEVERPLYFVSSHTFWNESETNMAVPCGRTCFSCCHPRRGSAFLTVRVHPPGMAPKAVISTGGEAGVERPLYFIPSHTF